MLPFHFNVIYNDLIEQLEAARFHRMSYHLHFNISHTNMP